MRTSGKNSNNVFGLLVLLGVIFLLATGLVLPRGSWAAGITFVQGADNDIGTNNSSITCTLPSSSATGNLIVVAARWVLMDVATVGTLSDDRGNTYSSAIGPVDSLVSGHAGGQVWYLANAKGGIQNITLTWNALTGGQIACHEYSGAAAVSVFDQATYTIGSGVSLNSGNVTTTFPNEMLFGWGLAVGCCDPGTFAAGGSYTLRRQASGGTIRAASEDQFVSAKGTYNATETTTLDGGTNLMFIVTFKAAVGAVQVSSRSDTLSDSRPSATSNHTIAFTINNSLDTTGWGGGSGGDATDTLAVTFSSNFNLADLACKDVDISFGGTATSIAGYNVNRSTRTNCPGSATSWGLFIDSAAATLTFYTPTAVRTYVATGTPVQILIGTNASFQDAATQRITNPSTAGIYTISVGGTFGGSGNILVSINSAVTVQATVAESLSLTVNSIASPNCTADDGASITQINTTANTVPFGTISANAFYQGCQDLVVSTNAGSGYSLTVQESSSMKTQNGAFTIPDTTCDAGTCSESAAAAWATANHNGFGHTCFNQDGNHDCDSSYSNGTNFRQLANIGLGETPHAIMSSSTPATATGRIKFRLSAGNAQPAGTYKTLITYTILGTF